MADEAVPACQPAVNGDSGGEKEKEKEKKKRVPRRWRFERFLFPLSLLSFSFVMTCSEADTSHTWVLGCREGKARQVN